MKKTITILDMGTKKVVALIAEIGGFDDKHCDIIGAGTVDYDGYMSISGNMPVGNGQMQFSWNEPDKVNDAIGQALTEAEKQAGRNNENRVHVAVPAAFCSVRIVETKIPLQGADPKVTEADIQKIMDQATNELMPGERQLTICRSPAWFKVDNGKATLRPVGTHGYELSAKISFILVSQFFFNEMTNRLSSMGITAESFVSVPYGQGQLYISDEKRDNIAVLIDAGYLVTDVTIYEGEAVVDMRTIPMGGGHIARDLAYGLDIRLASAEAVKREYIYDTKNMQTMFDITQKDQTVKKVPRGEVKAIIEPRAEEICEQIVKAIEESNTKLRNFSTVYLTGGAFAINRGGREFVANKTKYTIHELPEKSTKLSSPFYTSTLGALETVWATMKDEAFESGKAGKGGFFRNLFGY